MESESTSETDRELARDLGVLEADTIRLGTTIGAGVFVLPSIPAEQAGPASMIAYRALGPFFGSIVGWGTWAGVTFASAFYRIGFGQYLLPGLGQ